MANIRYSGSHLTGKQDSTLFVSQQPPQNTNVDMMFGIKDGRLGQIADLVKPVPGGRPKYVHSPVGVVTSWPSNDGPPTAGVVTSAQFQCLCIIAFNLHADGRVNRATFLHYSSAPHLGERTTKFIQTAAEQAPQWLVIAGQAHRSATMVKMKDAILPQLQVPEDHVFFYEGTIAQDEQFGFGFDSTGKIGQVEGKYDASMEG